MYIIETICPECSSKNTTANLIATRCTCCKEVFVVKYNRVLVGSERALKRKMLKINNDIRFNCQERLKSIVPRLEC